MTDKTTLVDWVGSKNKDFDAQKHNHKFDKYLKKALKEHFAPPKIDDYDSRKIFDV
ncbi:MAG: hypothetical protein ACLFN8_04355 [Candidatus Woesearchaeota archaeon]